MKSLRITLGLAALLTAGSAFAADNNAITVWVDAVRQPAVEAFVAANPDVKINMVLYDASSGASGSLQTKIGLADQAGEGWPDVVFSTQNNDVAWIAKETNGVQAFAAVLNKGMFDQAWLDGFTPGALDPVTVDGNVYGLRNDLAPVLFWYNKALLDKFGYDVPKTWEDYQALGDKLAADHPGYFLGSVGDGFEGPYIYYWGGEAPIFQVKGDTFMSDVNDPNSKKVTALLDHMLGTARSHRTACSAPALSPRRITSSPSRVPPGIRARSSTMTRASTRSPASGARLLPSTGRTVTR